MGKHGKKQRHQNNPSARQRYSLFSADVDEHTSSLNYSSPHLSNEEQQGEEEEDENENENENENEEDEPESICNPSNDELIPSKFSLYQQSVQSPKGDISYLQKFFLTYVGGRVALHLQEDFCGTALLSTEWLRADPRRTAIGVDLDLDALVWCMENNINKVGDDNSSRISLIHGNVLKPHEATPINLNPEVFAKKITINDSENITQDNFEESNDGGIMKRDVQLPARDIVCAFNYSCCCLHKRKDLVSYFKHALNALSKKGGIFVMDLYGGTSSERELKLQRKFPNFTYTWEQADFDVIQRKTRISLHYQLHKPQKKIRNAFSYSWRLWSLPEIRDCLEEVGFRGVHFWIKEMPDMEQNRSIRGFGTSRDDKYEEVTSFPQQDAWNAYVVAVV